MASFVFGPRRLLVCGMSPLPEAWEYRDGVMIVGSLSAASGNASRAGECGLPRGIARTPLL